jgi:hypothetical protein
MISARIGPMVPMPAAVPRQLTSSSAPPSANRAPFSPIRHPPRYSLSEFGRRSCPADLTQLYLQTLVKTMPWLLRPLEIPSKKSRLRMLAISN